MDTLTRMHNDPDSISCPAFVRISDFRAGEIPAHKHRRGQLSYAIEGAITVKTEDGLWVTPTKRAVWIAPGTMHSLRSSKNFRLAALWMDPSLAGIANMPKHCCVMNVDGLTRELLRAAAEFGSDYRVGSAEERVIQVILDRLVKLSIVPLCLPEPRDSRLKKVTEALKRDLSESSSLEVWAQKSGITQRTAARLFRQETGMTFGQWRLQLRLLTALEQLASGDSVSNVALNVGYRDVSSFIAVFKETLGETPAKYFKVNQTVRRQ